MLGINAAPKIILVNLKAVLKKRMIQTGTDCYIDDILLDETAVPTANLVSYLNRFGLTVKLPESLGAALGL